MEVAELPKHAELSSLITESGVKQVVCPPDIPKYAADWVSPREEYLISRGWEKEGESAGLPTYRDPRGSRLKGEYRKVGELPVKGDDLKKSIEVHQFHVPPATFSFTLEEAVEIQRRRDAHGGEGPSPLERLDTCEHRCNDLARELEHTRVRIKILLTTNGITFEGLKLGLRELIGV